MSLRRVRYRKQKKKGGEDGAKISVDFNVIFALGAEKKFIHTRI